MREIVYINAGNLSNHIGTHFFNTQQAYLEQAETNPQEESPIDSNVSFRDGISNVRGIPTYCPRLLTFDYKQNFGALSKHNELYPASQDDSEDPLLEAGLIASHRAPLIPPSPYQVALAESRDFEITLKPRSVRYWSDYNRVFHLPRSLHPVPPPFNHQDLGSDEIVQNWSDGREAFSHLDAGTEICDEALRRFVEECDLLQGFQSMFDSLSFGSFTLAMIEAMGDEYPKSASLAFVNFGDTSSFVPSSLASVGS
ncbi:hypothetical protein BOTBODRAFT_106322 [Botryobasidium botryosum FD-172 SS1]|uniref:Uncharacterized protein n=1 Tax=Botryobasidium botryosum (strain FD-172 SS1) TaxID=930990 RepID=A0A067MMZ7_BOTB1|nr:hypothetical protein BOTBODRAFT_106322 [Botryobasidium botryosum FD-172 SS1]